MKKAFSAQRLAYIALAAALTAVCAWISVPAPVPFTLQTFAVFALVLILGGRDSAVAILVYLFLGAVGLPVFAGFKGGPGVLFGPTGGYLWGFLFISLLYLIPVRKSSLPIRALLLAAGLAACYAFGTFWFVRVYSRTSPMDLSKALSLCVLPFILPDLAKLALALPVGQRVRKALNLSAGS